MEYPAMIYKNNRAKGYIANCMIKNTIGFGPTEEDAITNLKYLLNADQFGITVKPVYSLLN